MQGSAVGFVVLLSNHGHDSLSYHSCGVSHATWCWKTLVGKGQFPTLVCHDVFFSSSCVICSIKLGEYCSGFVQKDWIPGCQKIHIDYPFPKNSLPQCPVLHHLLYLLCYVWVFHLYITGCRQGSVPTPWHTLLMSSAVMSWFLFDRLMDIHPPSGHGRACITVNKSPQIEWENRFAGCHPYIVSAESISESPLVEGKFMLLNGQDRKLARVTLSRQNYQQSLNFVTAFVSPKEVVFPF